MALALSHSGGGSCRAPGRLLGAAMDTILYGDATEQDYTCQLARFRMCPMQDFTNADTWVGTAS